MAYHQHHPTPRSGSGSITGSRFHFLNSPFGDTTETKVFVGGLAWETKNESLRQYFIQFGEILEAVVITDKNTGRSKGYGFVTFRDPESAKRACADPSPVIDGRRANCNLASLKRVWPSPSPARMRPTIPFIGGPQGLQGSFVGGSAYPQQIPYNYPHGFMYPQYGYMTYGQPEYVYPQNVFNPYPGQQYVVHGVPGSMNPVVCPPLGQLAQHVPTGHGFTAPQGYASPGYHFMQFPGPNVNGATSAPISSIQTSYPPGVAGGAVGQPMFAFPTHSPQFPQGSGPDQNIS